MQNFLEVYLSYLWSTTLSNVMLVLCNPQGMKWLILDAFTSDKFSTFILLPVHVISHWKKTVILSTFGQAISPTFLWVGELIWSNWSINNEGTKKNTSTWSSSYPMERYWAYSSAYGSQSVSMSLSSTAHVASAHLQVQLK